MNEGAPLTCKKLTIKGIVQGVNFRAFTLEKVLQIGRLQGWVCNLPNGDVEVLVQGEPFAVETLIQCCSKGPSRARVDKILTLEMPVRCDLPVFQVR